MKGLVFVPPGNHKLLFGELEVRKVVAEPKQKSVGPLIETNGTEGAVELVMAMSVPLSEPIRNGKVETTRIL
jgi:hypothetical protein